MSCQSGVLSTWPHRHGEDTCASVKKDNSCTECYCMSLYTPIIAFRRIWIRNFQMSFSETKTDHFGVAHTLTGIDLYQCTRVSSYESKPAEIAWCKLHWHKFIRVSRVILVRVNHLQTRNNAENNFIQQFYHIWSTNCDVLSGLYVVKSFIAVRFDDLCE